MRKQKPVAYLASPFGFSEAGRLFYNDIFVPLVEKAGFDVLDPWALTPQKDIDAVSALSYGTAKKRTWEKLNMVIGKNNTDAIKKSDIVVAVLDGTDVDSGTSSEIGYAAALGKRVIGYRGDFRLSADNEGSIVNLQVEYFIRASGGDIVTNIKTLRELLIKTKSDLANKRNTL